MKGDAWQNVGYIVATLLVLGMLSGCSALSETGKGSEAFSTTKPVALQPEKEIEVNPLEGFTLPDPADLSNLSWSEAFMQVHAKLAKEYAFTDWKGVSWPDLLDYFLPRIKQAEANQDEKAYYLALHEYIYSIPDGHISLTAHEPAVLTEICREQVGGSYGLAVAELDDWRVVAAVVVSGGPAALAGMETGAEIVAWDEIPAQTAISSVDIAVLPYRMLTAEFSPSGESSKATTVLRRLEQAKLLTRGPVGRTVAVSFRNPGVEETRTEKLSAVLDADPAVSSLNALNFAARPEFSSQVDVDIREGFGYIRLRAEVDMSDFSVYPTAIFQAFQNALTLFVDTKIPGVIIDLRGNYGGSDELVSDLCGFFYDSMIAYEYLELYDKRTDSFLKVGGYPITPAVPTYTGPVVALVNPGTISSGEGLAAGISHLVNGAVIGFHGTNGSFGIAGGEILLPGDYLVKYPYGRSVDSFGVVQLDSRNGMGGVIPTWRIPKTIENILAYAKGDDVEFAYAVKYLRTLIPAN